MCGPIGLYFVVAVSVVVSVVVVVVVKYRSYIAQLIISGILLSVE